jgi:pSer/pThr/pTyr-binding forkhead associated (FHA) protein
MLAQLIPLDGSKPIAITRDLTLVGRKRGLCDIILASSSVSKLHCAIAKTDGLLFIRDLGSTNGTKVNGQRVTRGALLPGDELAFANAKFRVHLGPAAAAPLAMTRDRTEQMTAFPKLIEEVGEDEHFEPADALGEDDPEVCLSGEHPA